MSLPKAYEPIQGQMYQILTSYQNQSYEHCDYAKDKQEKEYLLKEYRMSYGNDFKFKVIKLPKKYHNEVKELDKYRVIDYFDVWWEGEGEEGGWQVNNLASIGEIEVNDYTDYSEIVRKLKEIGYLSDKARKNSFEVYNDYEMIEFFIKKEKNKPMFRLELIQK